MKKAFPLILVLIGAALVITAVVFWIDSSTSTQPDSFGKSLRDWITLILGIGASIKGWMDLFKKEKPIPPTSNFDIKGGKPQISTGDHARNIQAETYIENQTIQQPLEPKTPKSLNQLPVPPLDFIGREKELDQLRQNIEKGVLISGVQGMGGIGKTALGLKLAEQIAHNYSNGQIYLDLRGAHEQTPLTPEQVMAHVIRSFHPEASLPIDFGELSAMYRSVLGGKKALLFYDNARDEKQLDSLLPPKSCTLFVTSRQYFTLPGLVAIDLETLDPKDAIGLVQEISSRVNYKDAEILAKLCGYLPLAIRAAASVLQRRPDWSAAELIKKLGDNRARLGLVESSLSLSYEALDADLQKYLRQLGVFAASFDKEAILAMWFDERDLRLPQLELVLRSPSGISDDTAIKKSSEQEVDDILGELLKTSLLKYDHNTNEYYFHDLTHLFLEEKVRQDEKSDGILWRYAEHYLNLGRQIESEYTGGQELVASAIFRLRHIWVHLNTISERLASENKSVWKKPTQSNKWLIESAFNFPYCLNASLSPKEYMSFLQRGLIASRNSNEQTREAFYLNFLGYAEFQLGNVRRAMKHYEQSLGIYRGIEDKISYALPLGNLGGAYLVLGDPNRAIECCTEALSIAQSIGDKHGEGKSLGNLGAAYLGLGNVREAIQYFEKGIIVVRGLGDKHDVGFYTGNLGSAYRRLGELDTALDYQKQSLAISIEIGDRYGEGSDWDNIGNILADKNDFGKAIDAYQNALKISEEIGDESMQANVAWNLATVYNEQEKYDLAAEYMQITIDFEQKINHPNADADLEELNKVRAKIQNTSKPRGKS